ncbi:MAG: DUF2269 family protein [Deltaproteobacteria bacterium]|jgi:hypothetical protein|nr:DUF2269 family protein [Deltaproteobacteria bacterium]
MAKVGLRGLRILKTFHLITACLWLGGAVGLTLMLFGMPLPETDGQLYGYNLSCKFIDDFVIIPGAIGCLLTGLLISLLTQWGFFKHRWIIIKWVLTVFCILFGTFFLSPTVNGQPRISAEEGLMALANVDYVANYHSNLKGGIFQLVSIVFMIWLSVFKPLKGRGKPLIPKTAELPD